jgi:2-methylisocitrate lyase-like PEP mutase family enzyme
VRTICTVARLLAYQEAGADVLYAPGLERPEDIRELVDAVDRPVNVLGRPAGPSVGELAALGVSRISVGGALAFAALDELVEAADEFRERGTFGFMERSRRGARAAVNAFRQGA